MKKSPLRIVFAGTPNFAETSLQALLNSKETNQYNIVGVYTQPDRPAGRGQKLVASPVKLLALKQDIPVFQPINFKDNENKAKLKELDADIMIVAAYGIILPKDILETPKMGCINVHGSILPRWRGAAPIHRAIIAGDDKTGITIMQMDVGLDTGDMLLKAYCDIETTDTSGSLHDKLAILGGKTLIRALEKLKVGKLTPEKQDNNLTCYADKLTKQEANIDWNQDAKRIERQIRGLSPWPVAYTQSKQGIMKIYAAGYASLSSNVSSPGDIIAATKEGIIVATGDGTLRVTEIQFTGGKRIKVQEVLNGKRGHALHIGQCLGSVE